MEGEVAGGWDDIFPQRATLQTFDKWDQSDDETSPNQPKDTI